MNIPLYRLIDRIIGTPLCLLLGALSKLRPTPRGKTRRMLLIKLWAVGDSIVSLPTLRALRKAYPQARIDVLCRDRNKFVYEGNKDTNHIILFELRNALRLMALLRQYDVVLDTEPYMNLGALISWWAGPRRLGFNHGIRRLLYTDTAPFLRERHMVNNYLAIARPLGTAAEAKGLVRIATNARHEKEADAFIDKEGIRKKDCIIAIHAGLAESAKSRRWMPERFAALADKLIQKHNARVIFTGGPGDAATNKNILSLMKRKAVDSAGRISLRGAAALLKRCNLMISVDTGTMHLAAAQGTRTIGLFGPNVPSLWAPYGKDNIALYHRVACSPCIINEKGRAPDCLRKRNRYECMRLISVYEVMEAAKRCLKR